MIYLYRYTLTDFSTGNIKIFQKSHFKTSYRHNIIISVSKPKTMRLAKLLVSAIEKLRGIQRL